jgi:hypothetical protein
MCPGLFPNRTVRLTLFFVHTTVPIPLYSILLCCNINSMPPLKLVNLGYAMIHVGAALLSDGVIVLSRVPG